MTTLRIDRPGDSDDGSSAGQCPRCGTAGPVGSRCEIKSCRAQGYHVVPRAAEAHEDPRVGLLVGPFLVTRALGGGRFEALRVATEEEVTLRLIEAESDDEVRRHMALVARHRKIAATIGHPGIRAPREVGAGAGHVYVLDEQMPGQRSLQAILDGRRRSRNHFSDGAIVEVLGPVFEILARAHEAGFEHLDLLPGAIQLAPIDVGTRGGLAVRVAWFSGGDEREHARVSRANFVTPYHAPEQWTGHGVGHTADLFAMGVIAYELLTLGDPSRLKSSVERERAIGALPPALATFLETALHPDPRYRYENASTMRLALEMALSGQVLPTESETPTLMLPKPVLRDAYGPTRTTVLEPGDFADLVGDEGQDGEPGDAEDSTETVILGRPGALDTVLIELPRTRRR